MSQYLQKGHFGGRKAGLTEHGSQCSIDGVAMGTGVSTHTEVTGCWNSCRAERNHLEGPFCLWQWWTALKKNPTTHKCKCRVSRRKVRETHCGEAFGWIVVRGCCLRCQCNVFSVSAWCSLNLCGCSSAPRHSYVYLHLRGCNWTTLSAKTSSEHQLLLRWKLKHKPKPEGGMSGKGLNPPPTPPKKNL